MAGLVAPGVCRYTVQGTYGGRSIANIVDLYLEPTGGSDRHDMIEAMAGIIISAWADDVLDNIVTDYTAESLSWVDLDNAGGEVGSQTAGSGTDFPASGLATDQPMPGNVAFRVNKSITAARGQRQGRMYLVGVPETATAANVPNTISGGVISAVNSDMAAFLGKMNVTLTGAVTGASALVVLHTHTEANPSPPPATITVYDDLSLVTALTLDSTLGSQRRRLRG